jgi:hypothetical protein
MATITVLLSDLLDAVEGALQQGAPLTAALTVTPNLASEASAALARSAVDAASPQRVDALRTSYEMGFGFTQGLRQGFQRTIWEPWRGLNQSDMEAVLVVSDLLGIPASHVLALWLQEGKHAHDGSLHGQAHPLPNLAFGADVTTAQIRAWVRSLILYQVFGSDAYTHATKVPGADNRLDGADADHDGRFVAGLARLRAGNVPGSDQFTNQDALGYFSTTAGALRSLVLTDVTGGPVSATLPAGVALAGSVRLRPTSIASWLYLQVALFTTYRADMEQLFIAEYGPPMDLMPAPWVTYLGWNGGLTGQYNARFSRRPLGESPEDRIRQLFGNPPAGPLNAAELTLYYAGGISTEPSRSALGNAIQFKYLTEAVQPWFAPAP